MGALKRPQFLNQDLLLERHFHENKNNVPAFPSEVLPGSEYQTTFH